MEQKSTKQDCVHYLNNIANTINKFETTLKDFKLSMKYGIKEYPNGYVMIKEHDGTVKINIEIEYKVE